jgi:hypothetical protein
MIRNFRPDQDSPPSRAPRILRSGVRSERLPPMMDPAHRAELLRARWRVRNGLEARVLVALARAPEVLARARTELSPEDFLTPPYAVAAALLFALEADSPVLQSIEDMLDARPYLVELTPHEWEREARELVALMLDRRGRWARARTNQRRSEA